MTEQTTYDTAEYSLRHFGYEPVQERHEYGGEVWFNADSHVYVFDVERRADVWMEIERPDGLHSNRKAHACDTVVVEITPRFYEDHVARDLATGYVEHRTKSKLRVRLDREAFQDLYGDASYYAGFYGDDRRDNLGLCTSAAATLRKLAAASTPDERDSFVRPWKEGA